MFHPNIKLTLRSIAKNRWLLEALLASLNGLHGQTTLNSNPFKRAIATCLSRDLTTRTIQSTRLMHLPASCPTPPISSRMGPPIFNLPARLSFSRSTRRKYSLWLPLSFSRQAHPSLYPRANRNFVALVLLRLSFPSKRQLRHLLQHRILKRRLQRGSLILRKPYLNRPQVSHRAMRPTSTNQIFSWSPRSNCLVCFLTIYRISLRK